MAYASPMKIANGLVLDFTVDNADTAADTFLGLNANGEVTEFASIPRARVSGGGNLTEATSSVLTITGGSAAVLTSGLTIQVKQASGAQAGYLSSADWTTFNNKLSNSLTSAYVYVGNGSNVATGVAISGDITISNAGVVAIASGVIVNADINASAAIAVSKLEAITASRVLGSDGSGVIQALDTATYPSLAELAYVKGANSSLQNQLNNKLSVTLTSPTSGDVITYNGSAWVNSPSSTGVPTGGTTAQILRKVDNTNYNTEWHTLVAADITDVSSTAAELNKLSGVTTTATQFNFLNTLSGDVQSQLAAKLGTSLTENYMFVGNASNVVSTLAPGTNGYVLTSVSGVPTWVSPGVGGTVTSVAASGGTTGMSFTGSPITTSGTLTLTGTLAIANGGTGLTALGTAGQLIKVNAGATALEYFTPTYISSVGTGVANELTYWSGTSTLGSLATATYPSLTEFSYVKGVTSSVQTQLSGKLPLSLTGTTSITGSHELNFGTYGSPLYAQYNVATAYHQQIVKATGDNVTLLNPSGFEISLSNPASVFKFIGPSAPSVGHVWTASNVDGTGYWAAPSSSGLTIGTSTIASGTNGYGFYNNSGVLGEFAFGTGVRTWLTTPSWTNFNSAITGTAPYWSLATGGTLSGVNTITSNAFSQYIFNGTATAGSAGLSFINYGGTVTAYNGTGTNYYLKVNPVFNGNGSGNTNIVAQFSHTGSGGTSPNYVDLMVGDFAPVTGYLFQAQTGYYTGNFRFDSNIRDNRDNNIVTQSASGLASNRTLTIGNTSYSTIDMSHKGGLRSTQAALSVSPTVPAFKVTAGAHTNAATGIELTDVHFDLARTVERAAGAVTQDRIFRISAPTLSFVGSSTVSRASTLSLSGSPIAGTNAAITTSIGLEIESANVTSGTVNSYAAYFNTQTGATNNNALGITGGITSETNSFTVNAKNLGTVNSGIAFDMTVNGEFEFIGFQGTSGSVAGNRLIFTSGAGYGTGDNAAGDILFQTGAPNASGAEGTINIQARSTGKISFFNVTGALQQSVNAILVNNVTSGGSASTIADYSDLSVYSNDAATIRNNFYRLSEKVLKLETALRNYGLVIN